MRRFALVLVLLCPAAAAQSVPDYGLDFLTIGDPGNRGAIESEQPMSYAEFPGVGAVDYEYRITRSPLTATQWVEFVNAYAPFWDAVQSPLLTGSSVRREPAPGGGYVFVPYTGEEQAVNGVSWHLAAAMCNWLHNGRVNQAWAFETGAYDLTGFDETDPSAWTPPMGRSPDARFWIPSLDEFVKAAYYDPDRYGPGQEGYWLYPDRGNDPLVEGFPEDGGETIGWLALGTEWDVGRWPVGQYPDVQSHYGLLDVSGTKQQWLEAPSWGTDDDWKATVGSRSGMFGAWSDDRIDTHSWDLSISTATGLRLAMVVPGTPSFIVFAFAFTHIRRRRSNETAPLDARCRGGLSVRPSLDTVHVLQA